jgi:hypothetical protein
MSETKRPHGSRLRDALVIINPGACNPSGVAISIADACREMREQSTPAARQKLLTAPATGPCSLACRRTARFGWDVG